MKFIIHYYYYTLFIISTFILYELSSARLMIVYKAPDLQVKYHSKQN